MEGLGLSNMSSVKEADTEAAATSMNGTAALTKSLSPDMNTYYYGFSSIYSDIYIGSLIVFVLMLVIVVVVIQRRRGTRIPHEEYVVMTSGAVPTYMTIMPSNQPSSAPSEPPYLIYPGHQPGYLYKTPPDNSLYRPNLLPKTINSKRASKGVSGSKTTKLEEKEEERVNNPSEEPKRFINISPRTAVIQRSASANSVEEMAADTGGSDKGRQAALAKAKSCDFDLNDKMNETNSEVYKSANDFVSDFTDDEVFYETIPTDKMASDKKKTDK